MADKKQIVKTFSVKKTDNPVIEKFIKKQTNFSESIRYLIIKFCSENGVKDISSKLSEIMYNIDFEQKPNDNLFTGENYHKSNSEIVKHKEQKNDLHNSSEVKTEKVIESSQKDLNSSDKNAEITVDDSSKENQEVNQDETAKDISNFDVNKTEDIDDEEIPDCYQ